MLAILMALGAAASWGLGAIFVRRGMRDLGTTFGTLVSLFSGITALGAIVLVFYPDELFAISASAIGLFAIVGILNFAIGRYCNYVSVGYLGVGRSSTILAAAPVFAMALAVAFAGETLNLGIVAGTALVLGGLYVTLKAPRDAR